MQLLPFSFAPRSSVNVTIPSGWQFKAVGSIGKPTAISLRRAIATAHLALAALAVVACGRPTAPPSLSAPITSASETKATPNTASLRAPHGGTLIDLGDIACLELLLDRSAGNLTLFVLDHQAARPVRISQPAIEVMLDGAGPGDERRFALFALMPVKIGALVGSASTFSVRLKELRDVGRMSGRVLDVVVDQQEFRDVRFDYPNRPTRQRITGTRSPLNSNEP